jgi:hypothetical protein
MKHETQTQIKGNSKETQVKIKIPTVEILLSRSPVKEEKHDTARIKLNFARFMINLAL